MHRVNFFEFPCSHYAFFPTIDTGIIDHRALFLAAFSRQYGRPRYRYLQGLIKCSCVFSTLGFTHFYAYFLG